MESWSEVSKEARAGSIGGELDGEVGDGEEEVVESERDLVCMSDDLHK